MLIKSYIADTASSALKQVRTELGQDAVILRTRQLDDSGIIGVEITACAEKVSAAFDGGPRKPLIRTAASGIQTATAVAPFPASPKSIQPSVAEESFTKRVDVVELLANIESKIDALSHNHPVEMRPVQEPQVPTASLVSRLKHLDFSSAFTKKLMQSVSKCATPEDQLDSTARYIADSIDRLMAPMPVLKRGDVLLFYGLAGCGVQSMMAAISAHLVSHENQKVELLSIDLETAGKKISSDRKITLINAPLLPLDAIEMQSLRYLVEQIQPTHRMIVVSAMHRADDLADWSDQLAALEPTHMSVTMADRNKRFGSWLSLADALNTPVVMGTKGFGNNASLMNIDPATLIAGLLTAEETV